MGLTLFHPAVIIGSLNRSANSEKFYHLRETDLSQCQVQFNSKECEMFIFNL